MPLINLSVKHGRTLDEARALLQQTVDEVTKQFAALVQKVEWADDRNAVAISGTGFTVEMRVDAESVYVTGDIPLLGRLLGQPVIDRLKGVLENKFQKRLT